MNKGCLIGGVLGALVLGAIAVIGAVVASVYFGWVDVPWQPSPAPRPTATPVTTPIERGPTEPMPATPSSSPSPITSPSAASPTTTQASDEQAFAALITGSMTTVKNAIQSGDFHAMYQQLSDYRKNQQPTTPEELKGQWQQFAAQNYDLDAILRAKPVLNPPPVLAADGALVLEGHFPTGGAMDLGFKAWYHPQAGEWALSYITAQMKPPAGADATLRLPNDAKTFTATRENIPAALRSKFVPFSFDYPEGFTVSVPGEDTYVRVNKGDTVSFSVSPASFSTTADKASAYTPTLSAISAALGKTFPTYQEVSRGTETVSGVQSRTLLWEAKLKDATLYGKCLLLRQPKEKSGVVLVLVSSSLDPELKTAADIGTRGELGGIVRSFRLQ